MKNPLSRRSFLTSTVATAAGLSLSSLLLPKSPARAAGSALPVFEPTWESLAQYQVPDWFRDAKFGIWAHWGPQCVPEQGDWYARSLYQQYGRDGKPGHDYVWQCEHYGHPSKAGFKDVIRQWKAESWDPAMLIGLYKDAGAKYFMSLGNHHDNFDNFDSKYQPWNSVALGPKKDIVGGWAKAARSAGLRYGVTLHAARTWGWYDVSQGADKDGPLAGVRYDGAQTAADGKGQWWEGLDPQELYAQNHPIGAPMSAEYMQKFYNRVIDVIDKYHPDLLYFDDSVLPFGGNNDTGLRIASHLYNTNMARNGGRLEAVMTTKNLNPQQRKCLVYDIERGVTNGIEPIAWQSETCIGQWHYSRGIFDRHGYKKPETVLQTLADIVSKNGNFLLNIPLPGSGMPDSDEMAFLAEMKTWMRVNGEGIFGSRPWRVYGEGPSVVDAATQTKSSFNEGKAKPYTSEDLRFTSKGDALYAYLLAWPDDGKITITSLAQGSPTGAGQVSRVELLGTNHPLVATADARGLTVRLPSAMPSKWVNALKLSGPGLV